MKTEHVGAEVGEKINTLAKRLASNPNRTTNVEFVVRSLDYRGFLSSERRGGGSYGSFDKVKKHEDHIHFVYGPPYVFNERHPNTGRVRNAVVVLNGDSLVGRKDLEITMIDSGLIYARLNPYSQLVKFISGSYPEIVQTDMDPTKAIYDALVDSRNGLLEGFQNRMNAIYQRLRIQPDELEAFLADTIAARFPLDMSPINSRIGLKMPEGNVRDSISTTDWQCILVYEEDYEYVLSHTSEGGVEVVNVGSIKNEGWQGKSLLTKYLDRTDTKELFH